MDLSTLYQQYADHGLVLVPIQMGQKRPIGYEWNHRENCILPPGWAEAQGGVGLAHAFSDTPTCAIDLDKLREALQMVSWAWQVDLQAYIDAPDAVWIVSGRDNRLKLLYRMPPGLVMPTAALELGRTHVLQFRCATKAGLTVQDVLPPTVHPDTGNRYQWGGRGDWRALPVIPWVLLRIWQDLLEGKKGGGAYHRSGPGLGTERGQDAEIPEYNDETIDRCRAMLEYLNPDMGRDPWYRVGMALHSVSEDLYTMWDEWSSRGAKYAGTSDTEAVWRSFSDPSTIHGEPVTFGTLRRYAYQAGYRDKIDIQALYRAAGFTGEHTPGPVTAPVADAPTPTEAPSTPVQGLPPAQGAPQMQAPTFEQVMEQARGLNPLDPVRPVLAQAVWFTPTEQDRLVSEISDQAGVTRTALRDELRQLIRAARESYAGQGTNSPNFPLTHPETGRPLDHVDNLQALCEWHGASIRFNEMTHDVEICIPNVYWAVDDWRNQQLYWIRDQIVRWGMPYARSLEHVKTLALNNIYHPLGQLLDQGRWDGVSRWQKVRETIRTCHPGQRDLYLRRWLISAVAAVRGWKHGVPPRGVIVFSGEQAQGKTSWLRYLTPHGLFGEGLHLDPGNKDSLKQAVSWWVVELGELDSTFSKSDISRLKAHISKGYDELRLPYAASESGWPRRTVYAGTVNKPEFLADQTGNTRFWPIETSSFDLDTMRGMWESGEIIQFWLEVEAWYRAGERWWLSPTELRGLEEHNEEFRDRPAIEETLEYVYRWDAPQDEWRWKTPTEIRKDCEMTIRGSGPGNQGPENTQFKEALKKLTGQIKAKLTRLGGGSPARRWRVPPKRFEIILGGKGESEE